MGYPASDYLPAVLRGAAEAQDYVYILGLREDPDRESWSLVFQECGEPDEQDRALGLDTYWNGAGVDSQRGCHGGVVECEIRASEQPTLPKMPPSDMSQLRLVLAEQAAATLRLPTEVCFTLRLPDNQLQMVKRGLVRVLNSGRPDATPRLLRM
ncbi:hypothetical protein DLE60_02740 [Micromonospora globispora]|uniref:Uncharacterized protein n=1 Tax=Micromonospora globispora TaxID=1450148 RepID=A0A317JW50_9ACTN|nr:hypothetical protein [Micromonospora globispora]PWU43702.1 hypothetical protein DLJ46_29960 [Micromonospora globispora]PWU61991.1 hypothetical protein DLE60_02740 [Micromonospora globispora]RQW83341.1 hypothetical protein DKL51_31740 [Micromonospora globispora]